MPSYNFTYDTAIINGINPLGIQFINFTNLATKPTAAQKSALSGRTRLLSSASSISGSSTDSDSTDLVTAAPLRPKKVQIVGLERLLKKMEEDKSGRFKVERREDGSVKITKFKRKKKNDVEGGEKGKK